MRIVLDSNILISALLFKNSNVARIVEDAASKHKLVLSNAIIAEVKEVIVRKFPDKESVADDFFAELSFEYQHLPEPLPNTAALEISDLDDRYILATAYFANADLLVTGDNHFFEKKYDWVKIIKPVDYFRQ